jgi:hypothetical protein
VSPFRKVPGEALAFIRIDPVQAVTGTSKRLVNLHDAIGGVGSQVWDWTGGAVVDGMRAWGDDVAQQHPGLSSSMRNLRQHGGALRRAMSYRDFASSGLMLDAMGQDVGAAWRSLTTPAAPERPEQR